MRILNQLGFPLDFLDDDYLNYISEEQLNSPLEDFFLFNGKGIQYQTPEKQIHLGHFLLYNILAQASKKIPVVFQISDDQKRFKIKPTPNLRQVEQLRLIFLKELAQFSWKKQNLFVFSNLENYDFLSRLATYINAQISIKKVLQVYGADFSCFNASYIGIQAGICALSKIWNKKPLVIIQRGELGYFLLLRDCCKLLNITPPVLILIKPTKDRRLHDKMSSSKPKDALFLNDLPLCFKKSISGAPSLNQKLTLPVKKECDFGLYYIDFLINSKVFAKIHKKLITIRKDYLVNKNPEQFKKETGLILNQLRKKRTEIKLKKVSKIFYPGVKSKEIPLLLDKDLIGSY